VIADEGADQEPRQPSAESLFEARVGARTGGVAVVERGAVLEEEHRPTLARGSVWCGCGHALLLSTEPGAPLHP
jgi:hypothetical protein